MGHDEIQIRVVPRSTNKPKNVAAGIWAPLKNRRLLLLVFGAITALLTLLISYSLPRSQQNNASDLSSHGNSEVETRIGASISRHMTDAKIRQEMMMRRQELDNAQARDNLANDEGATMDRSLAEVGPLMDHDKSAERVFEDLDLNSRSYTAISPHDKINARLANRKWLNEVERAERINFVRSFVRSAYDRGYEVQLNENLVVVGVRRIQKDRKVTIDQIMDRMAKQGF